MRTSTAKKARKRAAKTDRSGAVTTVATARSNGRSAIFDDNYYRVGLGPIPYERSPGWLRVFHAIADDIVRIFRPVTVLDVGCAFGMLVESLWDRNVNTHGLDVSEYAIASVRPDMIPYCRVGLATGDLGGPYDLITCIEVLEHLEPEESLVAIRRLCAATDTILFSSTPIDFDEPTHFNVQPPVLWIRQFAEHGFVPDVALDASFVAPQAMVFRRGDRLPMGVADLYARRIAFAVDLFTERNAREDFERKLNATRSELDSIRPYFEAAMSERDQLRVELFDASAKRGGLLEATLAQKHASAVIAERDQLRTELVESNSQRTALDAALGRSRAKLDVLVASIHAAERETEAVTMELRRANAVLQTRLTDALSLHLDIGKRLATADAEAAGIHAAMDSERALTRERLNAVGEDAVREIAGLEGRIAELELRLSRAVDHLSGELERDVLELESSRFLRVRKMIRGA